MGIGHCALGLAAKPAAPKVPLGVLLVATIILDLLAVSFGWAGIEGGTTGIPWSHDLFVSLAERLELKEGARVLELGPGPGYFSRAVARSIPAGYLMLVDLQREMLEKARRRFAYYHALHSPTILSSFT